MSRYWKLNYDVLKFEKAEEKQIAIINDMGDKVIVDETCFMKLFEADGSKPLDIPRDIMLQLLKHHMLEPIGPPNTHTKKACSNCNNTYFKGDKYCRYCGAPMGSPVFITDYYTILYGPKPPKLKIFRCTKCDYTWNEHLFENEVRFCRECGSKTELLEAE